MDLVRIVLLLVAVASQSECGWCWGDPPPEKQGQIISILGKKEHFQWQNEVPSSTSEGGVVTRAYWNHEVTLLKGWTNEVTTFHMTCAQNDDKFRAIIFITKTGETSTMNTYYPIKTLDVKTCQNSLLESVTIVRRGQWKMNGEKISQIVIVDQHADCKMDVFDAYNNKVKEKNKTCPPTNDRGSPSNGSGYVNGWREKRSADMDYFKNSFYVATLI